MTEPPHPKPTPLLSSGLEWDSLYRVLYENSADAIWLVDVEGWILDANPAACQHLGYPPEELRGKHVSDIDEDWDRERLAPVVERQLTMNESILVEGRQRRKDGTVLPVEISSQVLEVQGTLCFLATIRDISPRVAAQQELRRKNELLERAHRLESLGLLAGGIAHDINNLLTPILMQADNLDAGHSARASQALEVIKTATLRARELTQRLLLFSRKQVLQPRPQDLKQVVRGLEPTIRLLLRQDIEIAYELERGPVLGDATQLGQIVLNLVANAHDAMPEGGRVTIVVEGDVHVEESRITAGGRLTPGHYVVLRVIDEGIGMAPELWPRVFEPFFSTKSAHGTGLGLATVYGAVQQHGGAIEVESTPDEGASFSAYFPRHTQPPTRTSLPQMTERMPLPGVILLVEDDPVVRDSVERTLREGGVEVHAAANGEAALELAARVERIDVLLSDVIMPQMSGPTLATELRKTWPTLRILFMSGYVHDSLRSNELSDLDAAFVAKPFTPEELDQAIQSLLRTKKEGTG